VARRVKALDALLLERIRTERPVAVLATADRHGRPYSSLVSWWVARSPTVLALALDERGQALENIAQNPRVSMQVLGDDLVLSIAGSAEVARERIDAAPFKMAEVAVHVDQVVDQSVGGVRFLAPSYAFDPLKAHRTDVQKRILEELETGTSLPRRVAVLAEEDVSDL